MLGLQALSHIIQGLITLCEVTDDD